MTRLLAVESILLVVDGLHQLQLGTADGGRSTLTFLVCAFRSTLASCALNGPPLGNATRPTVRSSRNSRDPKWQLLTTFATDTPLHLSEV